LNRILVVLAALALGALALPPLWYAVFRPPPPELPPEGRRVEVAPGLAVNVLEAGTGPPVLLVHGHPGSAYDWQPTFDALARLGHRVIAYDRVGYGRSDGRPPGRVRVATNADELLGLLDALDLRDATLVGWSYGGATSIVAARRDPSRVGRLVLVGSVGPGIEMRGGPPELVLDFLTGPVLSWVERVPPVARRLRLATTGAAFHPAPVPDWYLNLLAANFARPHTLQAFRSEGRDLGGEADLDPSAIALPILVIQGADDRLVPFAVAEAIHARAEDSELRTIPDAGHMLPVTHAPLLASAIDAFGARPGAAPRP
jgi:pimeloyl-ACP methyl ester carboxylesterase